jgi:AcrR family transcriptional regulator
MANEELNTLLDRVRELYYRYGIKSVTMDDVARELGMSKKTLYQYVKDKHELVEKVLKREVHKKECDMEAVSGQSLNAIEEILEVNRQINIMSREHNPSMEYDLKKYYPELYRELHDIRRERMYNSILENLKKGKKEGLYREGLDEEIIAKLQVLRFESLTSAEVFTKEEIMSPRFFNEMFTFYIRGIANKKGMQFLEENKWRKDKELNH